MRDSIKDYDWDKLFDEDNKSKKYKELNDLGFESINKLSVERNNRWGWIVNGDGDIDIGFRHFNDVRKKKLNKGYGKIFKWIRKYYLVVIFVGLLGRVLWRVSLWILKYKG